MSHPLIIQRVLPHYRVPLFAELHRQYDLRVVTAAHPPGGSFLHLANPAEHAWALPVQFEFPDANDPFLARLPTDWILRKYEPPGIIAEFGMRISSSYSLAVARRLGRLRRLAFWSHGWQMGRSQAGIGNRLVHNARLPLFACADVLATYSNEGASWVRKRLPWKPVVPLGNCIDLGPARNLAATTSPTRFGTPQLLAVGRLTLDKNFDQSIRVVGQLRKEFPNISLTIIGAGPDHDRLASMIGPILAPHVRMLGEIYDEAEVAKHFLGADTLLVTGAAGLSVNHALAYSLPVVAYARTPAGPHHHPEIEYVVPGRSGILVERYSEAALLETLHTALSEGSLDELRNRIPQFVDANLDMSIMIRQFGKLLEAMHL